MHVAPSCVHLSVLAVCYADFSDLFLLLHSYYITIIAVLPPPLLVVIFTNTDGAPVTSTTFAADFGGYH